MSNRYTGNNHVIAPGVHIAVGNPSVILRDLDGTEWCVEWHYRFGPAIVHRRTQAPLDRQPGERSRFWLVAQWWHDQGGVVVDGVGVWQEPPIVETRYKRVGRNLIQDDAGDIVRRHWQGYENLGAATATEQRGKQP